MNPGDICTYTHTSVIDITQLAILIQIPEPRLISRILRSTRATKRAIRIRLQKARGDLCELCHEPLTGIIHIDHIWTVKEAIATKPQTTEALAVVYLRLWQDANLRLTHSRCNLLREILADSQKAMGV